MGSSIFVLLVLVCGLALAQDDMFQAVSPTSTPVPPHPGKNQTAQNFALREDSNASIFCLRMVAIISLNITYANEVGKNESLIVNLTGQAIELDDRSYCNSTNKTALLYVTMDDDDDEVIDPLYMTFAFKGGKDNWSLGQMNVSFNPEDYLKDYNTTTESVLFRTDNKLHDSPNDNIEFTRSYKCTSDQTLYFNETSAIVPIVHVSTLQVQAFQFEKPTTGAFDNARSCLLDTAGKANKIVPIAVGAALAGLVVVVLIAYLIGRLRSRRQSSYEALS